MSELIDRQAAIQTALEFIIEYLGDAFDEDFQKKLIERMSLLPSVQSELGWIPCSERLPSDGDYDETFTVTIQCEHYDGWDDYVTGYADWTPHGWDIQSNYMGQIKVTAWMPLPEVWKGCTENE